MLRFADAVPSEVYLVRFSTSGLAGVARARCRVECGALRSFINGKLLTMSGFAGGGIMAGS